MLPIRFRATVVRGLALASLLLATAPLPAQDALDATMQAQLAARPAAPPPAAPLHESPCVAGMAAGTYPCHNVDLVAFVPVASVGASTTNSLWGWTDPQDGTEYALVGLNNGIAFFDLGVPDHPLYLGKLPTHTGSSIWRDVRVHANHAYVVSDNNGAHGMQVFDLTRLRDVAAPPVSFTEDAHYAGQPGGTVLGRGHTININPATGYAYIPGTNTCPAPSANGALHMVDIRSPASPVFAGCVTTGSYTHETSCVTYQGPDSAHAGKEICFNANGPTDRIAIVDVSNKAAPVTLASLTYPGSGYPHQGDLTSDHRYLLLNDELDESQFGHNAKTLVWDVSDLDLPVLVGAHTHALGVIDHNLYVHDNHVYESNYESGFRVLRIDNLSQAQLTEIAYFDTYPAGNAPEFNGNWNNYRFPGSGLVIASGIDEGLFVLRPRLCEAPPAPTALVAGANGDNRIDLAWTGSGRVGARFVVERAQGGCGGVFSTVASDLAGAAYSDTTASGGVAYGYRVSESAGAMCGSAASACVVAQTTGVCNAPPVFAGVQGGADQGTARCRIDLAWNPATPACGSGVEYAVYRGADSGFVPGPGNRIADHVAATGFLDFAIGAGQPQHYVVRATDLASGVEEQNLARYTASASGPPVDGTFSSGAEPNQPPFDTGAPTPLAVAPLSPDHAGWHITSARVHAGLQSFWSTAAGNLCASLVTPAITLAPAADATLAFWHAWDTQAGIDGGVVEVSTDGGSNWQRLTPNGGYPNTIAGATLCGIAAGSGAFSSASQLAWRESRIALGAYAGQTIQLRWLYRSDGATNGQGWFVDDIALSRAMVPGPCATDAETLLVDGFE